MAMKFRLAGVSTRYALSCLMKLLKEGTNNCNCITCNCNCAYNCEVMGAITSHVFAIVLIIASYRAGGRFVYYGWNEAH